jgi:pSer/pThr/pTyr-binding forkhead associated (FHA) protein
MITCGRCGLQNRADLRFCADCGARLAAPGTTGTPPRGFHVPTTEGIAMRPQARPGAPPADAAAVARTEAEGPRCSRCGVVNTPDGRFCTACGNALRPQSSGSAKQPEAALICRRCNGSNTPGMSYCQFCGTRLGPEGPTAQAPPAAPITAPPPSSGASALEPPASLVVISQDGTPGAEHPLTGARTDVGREHGAIILASDAYVSPHHMRVSRQNGRFFVRDLESVNGVYVRLRGPLALRHGDLVLIGLEVLRFELVSDAERGLGPATERGTRVFGSPSVPRHARLCQMTVEGAARDVYYLCRDETVIGRESGDLVFTNDPFMSRRHAAISRDATTAGFTLADLDSSNGTYLAIRGEQELESGDYLRVGQHLFRLDVGKGRR